MQANILVLTHWSYKDALIQTYTLPYVNLIRKVLPKDYSITLVSSEQERLALTPSEIAEINHNWKQRNMELVAFPYKRFGMRKAIAFCKELFTLYRLVRKKKIRVIHAFCTPAGSIAYVLSVLTGRKLIIDSYEPHAESMVENQTWKKNGLAFKMLGVFEKLQTKRAAVIIATTEGMRRYAKENFKVDIKNFFVKPACVDFSKFFPREKDKDLMEKLGLENKIISVYAGKLGGIYLKDEVFDFIKQCYNAWGDRFRFVMLTNATNAEIESQITRIAIPRACVINQFVLHNEVPRYLSVGDFAINPVKPVPSKQYCTSIKDGEYWAMGLPVVITKNISDDSEVIEANKIGYVFKELNQEEYQKAVLVIEGIMKGNKEALNKKIYLLAQQYRSFGIAENIYSKIYN